MHGIERPIYHLPFDQQLRIVDSFLDAVDLEKYNVVANLRHQEFLEKIQNRYQDKITIFKDVGWLDLAQYSDLVVTRSSSICSEALFLKIPALIWNPFPEFPDIYESFECVRSPVLQRATNREELTLCMEFLNQNKIRDFDAYKNYISEEINIQHVLEKTLSLAGNFE
jgi:predicted glycosyltransferase